MAENWHGQLTERLQSSLRRRAYESIQVLILYWKDGPRKRNFLELITRSLREIGAAANEQHASSLLIIHYGGHCDADDDRHAVPKQEKRSVWAAHPDGEPVLNWYMIQDQFDHIKTSDTDILLLLDCCFAAQAGRARNTSHGQLDIMAASAMGMKTPEPGDTSFTSILLREIRHTMENGGPVDMAYLHGQMCNRKVELWATPIYMTLKKGKGSIQLHRLSRATTLASTRVQDSTPETTFIHLLVKVEEELDSYKLDEFSQWLGTDTPPAVSKLVCQTTSRISNAVKDIGQSDKIIFKDLDPPSKDEILRAWDQVVDLVELFQVQQHGKHLSEQGIREKRLRASEFVRELDLRNNVVLGALERNILYATSMDNQANLEEAIHDDTVNDLGMAEQFQLRQIIPAPQTGTSKDVKEDLMQAPLASLNIITEYKAYDQYMDKAELPGLTKRVELLANLLGSSKSPDFRTLKCLRWDHQPLENKYTLQFEVPKMYQSHHFEYKTLHSIIKKMKATARPTLDERFRVAFLLATALQKWHSVGWLHQVISSHNIIFFKVDGQERFDYKNPFLHGFEFARPDFDPSIGRALEDDASNIYRHPNRQGPSRRGHRKIHDIYSLGVVMLEIGLWQIASDMIDPRSRPSIKPPDVQNILQTASSNRLPHYIGESYTLAVDACLLSSLGVDIDDERGSYLARAFEHQVINRLRIRRDLSNHSRQKAMSRLGQGSGGLEPTVGCWGSPAGVGIDTYALFPLAQSPIVCLRQSFSKFVYHSLLYPSLSKTAVTEALVLNSPNALDVISLGRSKHLYVAYQLFLVHLKIANKVFNATPEP
ncbi:hypothetical protein NUW58_g2932 [Xylaria curta]|uniref:Uncharacterized protein n=1 Tax=Xylaria curta TaxID=42375 RepID=A0ACC1PD83_9PEZI|nr:hypothetical protein NUW58_g2932 [Xylaria curta]